MKKLYLLTGIFLSILQLSVLEGKPQVKNGNWEFLSAKKELNCILEKHWKKNNLSQVATSNDYTFIRRT
jgi:hypothetical protein